MSDDELSGDDFVHSGRIGQEPRINWRGLMLTIASALAVLWAGLTAAFWGGLFRGLTEIQTAAIETAIYIPTEAIRLVTALIERSFGISAASIQADFGVFAFTAGVVVIIFWFLILEAAVEFVRGWFSA